MKLLSVVSAAALTTALVIPNEQVLADVQIEDHHSAHIRPFWDSFKETIDEGSDSLEQLFDSSKDSLEEIFDSSKSSLEDLYESSKGSAEELYDSSKDSVDEIYDSSKESVEDLYKSSKDFADEVYDTTKESVEEFYDSSRDFAEEFYDSHKQSVEEFYDSSKNTLDEAFHTAEHAGKTAYEKVHEVGYDVECWLSSKIESAEDPFALGGGHGHSPHHGKPNHTVYELISKSKYTTKLAKLIDEDKDLVKILNGTAANYTVFAPTDSAFEKIPHHHKPSKDLIKAVLLYHISPDFYPAGRVLTTHTIPTLLKSDSLGAQAHPQRLSVSLGLRGVTLNYYSHVNAINVFGSNGVVHGVDTIIIPPPKVIDIIQFLPSEFSTLTLGLTNTGLLDKLNSTNHPGGTFFAPSNWAFSKLGPKVNAFLFSKYGEKYLDALLRYHVAPKNTLYTDAYYSGKKDHSKEMQSHIQDSGHWHAELPTLLEDRALSVDVGKLGPFIGIRINAFARVTVSDGVAKDGVIQVVSDVLIPPRKLGGGDELDFWAGEEMSVEELKERLEPFVGRQEM